VGRAVSIDPDVCIGSADCTRLVPEAFRLDEALGVSGPVPNGVAQADLELLVRAARQCPTNAIQVVDDEGNVVVESA
jgi:ferredoxin